MKKINNKGFTLVELLAIIIILAIILMITIPAVLGTIENSKKKSIENQAVAVKKWWNTTKASDELDPATAVISQSPTASWSCITTATAALAKISGTDFVISTTGAPASDSASVSGTTCSAVRINNGDVEIWLVTKPTTSKLKPNNNAGQYFNTATSTWGTY